MFISRHTLKWTKTCRSSGDFPHAHTAHFLLNRHSRRGNGDGTVIPAYSTRMAGERLAALLDALDWWLATGHADRLDEWA